jgi:hypothetical protein
MTTATAAGTPTLRQRVDRSGDSLRIRVQQRSGGSTRIASATPELSREATEALCGAARACGTAPESLLYARVDGVIVDSRLMLMELELIEPGLYLNLPGAEGAAERFADAVVRRALSKE